MVSSVWTGGGGVNADNRFLAMRVGFHGTFHGIGSPETIPRALKSEAGCWIQVQFEKLATLALNEANGPQGLQKTHVESYPVRLSILLESLKHFGAGNPLLLLPPVDPSLDHAGCQRIGLLHTDWFTNGPRPGPSGNENRLQ